MFVALPSSSTSCTMWIGFALGFCSCFATSSASRRFSSNAMARDDCLPCDGSACPKRKACKQRLISDTGGCCVKPN